MDASHASGSRRKPQALVKPNTRDASEKNDLPQEQTIPESLQYFTEESKKLNAEVFMDEPDKNDVKFFVKPNNDQPDLNLHLSFSGILGNSNNGSSTNPDTSKQNINDKNNESFIRYLKTFLQ